MAIHCLLCSTWTSCFGGHSSKWFTSCKHILVLGFFVLNSSFCDYQFYIHFKFLLIIIFLRSTESDHVKTNLIHKIHWVWRCGITKLKEFKDLLTLDQYSKYLNKSGKKFWYTFILDPIHIQGVYCNSCQTSRYIFICVHKIASVSEEASHKYN